MSKPKITCLRDETLKIDGIVYRRAPLFDFCLFGCEHRNNAMECPNNLIVCPHFYLRQFSIKYSDSVFCSDKTLGQTIENIKNQKVEKPYMSNAWAFGSTPDTRAAKDAKVKAILKAYDKKCKELKAAKDQQRLDEISADLEAGRYSISPIGGLFVDSDPGKLNRERITKAEYVKDKFEEPENTEPHKIDYESYIDGNNSDVDLEEPYRDLDNSKKLLRKQGDNPRRPLSRRDRSRRRANCRRCRKRQYTEQYYSRPRNKNML